MGNEMSDGRDSGVRGGRSQMPNLPCLFTRGIRSGREQGRRTGQDRTVEWDGMSSEVVCLEEVDISSSAGGTEGEIGIGTQVRLASLLALVSCWHISTKNESKVDSFDTFWSFGR
jgi:hypothetical protein